MAGSLLHVADTEVDFTALSLAWIPSSARIISIGAHQKGHGVLSVFALVGRELQKTSTVKADRPLRCGTFDLGDPQEREFCCGDFNGGLSVWDVETLSQTEQINAHADVLNSLAGGGVGSSELLTGGRDGEVKLWDRRALGRPTMKMMPEEGTVRRDCWTVTHSGGDRGLAAAGFDNGDVKVFDLRSTKLLWETNVSRGVSDINLFGVSENLFRLVVGTVHGKLLAWDDVTAPTAAASLHTHQLDKSTVWKTQLMSGGGSGNEKPAVLASCVGSGALCLSKLDQNGSISSLHTQQVSEPPLTCLAVSTDKPGLVATAACDNTIRLFYFTAIK